MGLFHRINDLIKSCYGQKRPKMLKVIEKPAYYEHLMVTSTGRTTSNESDYITLPSCTLGRPDLKKNLDGGAESLDDSQRIHTDTNDGYLEMRVPLEIKNEMIEHLTSNFMVRQQSRMIESLLRSKKFNEIKNGNNQLK